MIRLKGSAELQNSIFYEYDETSQPLGEGAMGRVYEGFCVNVDTNVKFPVAVKAIFENIPDRIIERARREASVNTDSPYLLKMYDFVEMPFISTINGQEIQITRYFIIMELLTGVTLYDLVQGKFSNKDANTFSAIQSLHDLFVKDKYVAIQKIMISVLNGVISLHKANFIHRDIDPSNIMVTNQGLIKLIDFGICKPIKSLGESDKNLTYSGVFMGKVNYAAPELIIGDVKHQNVTTDIYALGVLLFQLCAGHLPFTGEDNDVLLAHMRKKIPLKEISNGNFRKIISKSTQKSQQQRYLSAEKMLHDLESIDLSKKIDKQKWIISIASAIVVIVTVLLYIYKPDPPVGTDDIVVPEDEILFKNIQTRIWSTDREVVYNAFIELGALADKTKNKDAMFEYGLTFSVGNEYFNIPTRRQQLLNIRPDIERANLWLYRCYDADNTNYRAIYWLINNLIAKKNLRDSSVLLDEINDLIKQFDNITNDLNDKVVDKYKKALDNHRLSLSKWNK